MKYNDNQTLHFLENSINIIIFTHSVELHGILRNTHWIIVERIYFRGRCKTENVISLINRETYGIIAEWNISNDAAEYWLVVVACCIITHRQRIIHIYRTNQVLFTSKIVLNWPLSYVGLVIKLFSVRVVVLDDISCDLTISLLIFKLRK